MNFGEQLTRIRRWVRDPSANVFSEPFLRRLYNDEQQQLFQMLGAVANVQAVRTHPEFQTSYTHDFEWAYTGHADGEVYQVGLYYDTADYVYLYVWEPESLKSYNATTYEQGEVYTQPWEAWIVSTPFYPPPIPLPDDFDSALFLAHDRERIEPITQRELMSQDDTTWKTRTGEALNYWRDSKNNNWIRIYPLPALTWQDTEESEGDPDEAEYGSTVVDVDNNLLVVYLTESAEIDSGEDESALPEFLQKYIEYGTAAKALRANTEGRIESLADYWDMRKKAGHEVIKKFKRLKLSDRNIQFRTQTSGMGDRPKYPRLPSTYPDPMV